MFSFSHSGGDSWDSSGEEDDNMFGAKAKVTSLKSDPNKNEFFFI